MRAYSRMTRRPRRAIFSVRIDHQQQDSDPIGGNRSGKEGDEQADIDGQLDREKVTVSGARMVPPIIDAMPRSAQSPLSRKNPAEQRSERSPDYKERCQDAPERAGRQGNQPDSCLDDKDGLYRDPCHVACEKIGN